jgi:glycosyltransferase involved in cell wall biosynthesis
MVVQPEDGGVAEHVLGLALGLRRRGWRVEVATPATSAIREPLVEGGVVVHPLALTRAPGHGDLRSARALRTLDRNGGYRIVHAHSSKAGALVRGALPDARRLVYTPHCPAFVADIGTGRRLLYRSVEQALVPRSAAIIAVCEWERREVARALRGSGGRLRLVRNGVAAPPAAAPDLALTNFAAGTPLFGYIGRLDRQKDPLTPIRALARLRRAGGPPVRLAIVGNGSGAADVKSEIERLDLTAHARLFPFTGEMVPLLRALDVFVFSSHWEALPLAVLEAMHCGLPVVATDVGGVGEAVHDGVEGRLVARADPDAMAAAFGELSAGEAPRRVMAAAALAAARERFSLDRMVEESATVYSELLGRSS